MLIRPCWKLLLATLWPLARTQATLDDVSFADFKPSVVVNSTGLTDAVQWDGYSLYVEGTRAIIFSGEVHPFRTPVPGLYVDVMQKIKALGFNTVSFYTLWGLHNPSPGVLDFDGWKDLQHFINAANDAGLWLIARPGPYINAEISGGGIPGWVTALNCSLRTSDPVFKRAYSPYWEAVGSIFARNQISSGGPIIAVQIENEYYLDSNGDIDTQYAEDLESSMRSSGVQVPFTFNDASEAGRLVSGQGAVNICTDFLQYNTHKQNLWADGFDSYPQSSDCTDPTNWPYQVDMSYRPFLQNTSGRVDEPFAIWEYQAGTTPVVAQSGYPDCLPLYNQEFERVFYQNALSQNLKIMNFYMAFGGTNWGHLAFPRAITSYDYWAPISEDRSLNEPKYSELKLLGSFLTAATDFSKTWITGSSNSSYTNITGVIQVDELRNPDTQAGFYVVRHANSSSVNTTAFALTLSVWNGNVTVPVTLNGRDSRIIVSNYCFGESCLSYSSASVMTSTTIDEVDTIVLYGQPGQAYQFGLPDNKCIVTQLAGQTMVFSKVENGRTVVDWTLAVPDHSVLNVNGGARKVRVHLLDISTAYSSWSVGTGCDTTLIFGPHLVRSAVGKNATLAMTGDLNSSTVISFATSSKYQSFTWNEMPLNATLSSDTALWTATLPGPTSSPPAPTIHNWRYADSFPERKLAFDDSHWTRADKTSTFNPNAAYPDYTGKYNLYMQDYGYYVGNTILRGHFNGTSSVKGFNASLSTGTNGAGGIWVNGRFIGSALAPNAGGVEDVNVTYAFPDGLVLVESDNVVTILLDNTGLEETDQFSGTPDDIKSPRGLRGYSLIGGDEISWRVQGNVGGNLDYPDKVRGIYNTGGLYGERFGWHLPGFDDSTWASGGPGNHSSDEPGVRWYRGEMEVVYPDNTDLTYSFVFPNSTGDYRAQLYVNGWQYGRRFGDLGPQLAFPVPAGILINGTNTISLSVVSLNTTEKDLGIGGDLTMMVSAAIATSLDLKSLEIDAPSYGDLF